MGMREVQPPFLFSFLITNLTLLKAFLGEKNDINIITMQSESYCTMISSIIQFFFF